MSELKKVYKLVFVYNPVKNIVRHVRVFNGESEGLDECVKYLSRTLNKSEEIILGKSICNNYYQLYYERYGGGSSYVREDVASVNKFLNPSRIGVSLSRYLNEHNMWKLIKL